MDASSLGPLPSVPLLLAQPHPDGGLRICRRPNDGGDRAVVCDVDLGELTQTMAARSDAATSSAQLLRALRRDDGYLFDYDGGTNQLAAGTQGDCRVVTRPAASAALNLLARVGGAKQQLPQVVQCGKHGASSSANAPPFARLGAHDGGGVRVYVERKAGVGSARKRAQPCGVLAGDDEIRCSSERACPMRDALSGACDFEAGPTRFSAIRVDAASLVAGGSVADALTPVDACFHVDSKSSFSACVAERERYERDRTLCAAGKARCRDADGALYVHRTA